MKPTMLVFAGSLAIAVLVAGCASSGDQEATGNDSDAFDNDSMYGNDSGITPDELENSTTNESASNESATNASANASG